MSPRSALIGIEFEGTWSVYFLKRRHLILLGMTTWASVLSYASQRLGEQPYAGSGIAPSARRPRLDILLVCSLDTDTMEKSGRFLYQSDMDVAL
jgi:hypothetical protein